MAEFPHPDHTSTGNVLPNAIVPGQVIREVARQFVLLVFDVNIGSILSPAITATQEMSGPPSTCLVSQNRVNPPGPSTHGMSSTPRAGDAHLTVYDVSVRLVRTPIDARVEAGIHSQRWDVLDGSGRRHTDGIYFLCLTSYGRRFIRGLARIKQGQNGELPDLGIARDC